MKASRGLSVFSFLTWVVVSQAGNPILGAEQFFCSKWSCVGPLGVIQWEASLEDLRCLKSHFFFFFLEKLGSSGLLSLPLWSLQKSCGHSHMAAWAPRASVPKDRGWELLVLASSGLETSISTIISSLQQSQCTQAQGEGT